MKKLEILCCTLLLFCSITHAQKKAVTEAGDQVILYEDGTWKYSKDFTPDDTNFIKPNSTAFLKSKNASFLLKAKTGEIGFWIDPKKWSFGKAENNEGADFELDFKGQPLKGVIISEPTEIPIESYVQIALVNGRNAAPDLRIIEKEYRTVNGLKVLHLKMEGTQMGVKFSYYGYYFSTSNSTVQFIVASYTNTLKKNIREVDELLNGLVEIATVAVPGSEKNEVDTVISKSSLTQGAYSPYNNCRQYFTGKWKYTYNKQLVEVERTLDKTIEYTDNRKYSFEYSSKWIDSCKYTLTFKKTNKPNYNLQKVGESMTIEVLQIDPKEMKYVAEFRGIEVKGEMSRVK